MKLHSDFHDYYDTAVGYGVDDKVHYNRFTKKVAIKLNAEHDIPPYSYDLKPLLLGFCGQTHPLIQVEERDENHQVVNRNFFYSYEELLDAKTNWGKYTHNIKQRRNQIKQFFVNWHKKDDNLFLEYKVPIWMFDFDRNDQNLTLNSKLDFYQFQRIKTSIEAFQEISMYLSNILVEQKEPVVIADKHRIEQHGFDLKTSFRREKQRKV